MGILGSRTHVGRIRGDMANADTKWQDMFRVWAALGVGNTWIFWKFVQHETLQVVTAWEPVEVWLCAEEFIMV